MIGTRYRLKHLTILVTTVITRAWNWLVAAKFMEEMTASVQLIIKEGQSVKTRRLLGQHIQFSFPAVRRSVCTRNRHKICFESHIFIKEAVFTALAGFSAKMKALMGKERDPKSRIRTSGWMQLRTLNFQIPLCPLETQI